jgi:ankyrin repeat protein
MAEVNTQAKSPLHLAVEQDQILVAKLLIDKGANVNCRVGFFGCTPLYFAKSSEMSELLKQHGARSRMYFWAEIMLIMWNILERLLTYGLNW